MNLTGKASGSTIIRGKVNRLTELRGYSAYEIAVLNGFTGTEEEWLQSLRFHYEDFTEEQLDALHGVNPCVSIERFSNYGNDKKSGVSMIVNDAYGQKERKIYDGKDGAKGDKGDTGATGAQGPKGDTGASGVTPHIGANGNWYIGTTDTGVNASGETIPEYVITEAEAVAEKIIAINGDGESDKIPFVMACLTDLHYNNTDIYSHIGQALKIIGKTAPIDLTALIGDYIANWTEVTKETAVNSITELKRIFEDDVFLIGNHDKNPYPNQNIPKAEAFMRICRKNEYITNQNDVYGGYGYKDFENFKIRVLFLNTSDNANVAIPTSVTSGNVSPVINCHNISVAQLQWFAEYGLDFSDKADPSEWGIVVLSHVPVTNATWAQYWDAVGKVWESNVQNFSNMLSAYVNKQSYSVTLNGETFTKDFSTITNPAEVLVFINGHGHAEKTSTLNGFTHIWCPSVHPTTKVSDDGNTYSKTTGTAHETAFNVIVIDRANKKTHALIYGAGTDRVVNFSGGVIAQYSVTNNLTNCTTNNNALLVDKNGNYTATITANIEHALSNVTVTMGGTDITNTVYSNGVINIANVTGDIVVTAEAISTAPAYTNQIPISTDASGSLFVGTNGEQGYKTGYRLSLSGGGESSRSGSEVTGFIPATLNSIIRIKNIAIVNDNYHGIVGYDANKQKLGSTSGNKLLSVFPNSADENGVYTSLVLSHFTQMSYSALAYIRICSSDINETSILTVDEEIV